MNPIKIFQGDELGVSGRVLLGSTDKVIFRTVSGSVPPPPLLMGTQSKYENMPIEVYFDGWDPITPVTGVNPLSFAQVNDEIRAYKSILAALVHMLGGSVTFTTDEVYNAQKMDVEAEQNMDLKMLVLKIKE